MACKLKIHIYNLYTDLASNIITQTNVLASSEGQRQIFKMGRIFSQAKSELTKFSRRAGRATRAISLKDQF